MHVAWGTLIGLIIGVLIRQFVFKRKLGRTYLTLDDYKGWYGNVDGARYNDRLVSFTVFMVMVAPISVFCLYIAIFGNG
jgi:hypothetical protein